MSSTIYIEETEKEKGRDKYREEKDKAFKRYLDGEVLLVQRRIEKVIGKHKNGVANIEVVTQFIMIEKKLKEKPYVSRAYYEYIGGMK